MHGDLHESDLMIEEARRGGAWVKIPTSSQRR